MAVDAETLQAALIGYRSEQERITKAIADLQAQLKGGRVSASPKRTTSRAFCWLGEAGTGALWRG